MHDDHSYMSLVCHHCGNRIDVPVPCGNRFCRVCGENRRRKLRHKLSSFVTSRKLRGRDTFKLLTLSVPSSGDLQQQVTFLLSSFRRLRQRAFWRSKVRGGVFVVEITHGEPGWHAHIHAVIESAYLPWNQLSSEWRGAACSTGCHITAIPARAIVTYVSKYVTKSELPLDLQLVASDVLRGRRLFQPFGEWHDPINQIKTPIAVCRVCEKGVFVWDGGIGYPGRAMGYRPEGIGQPHYVLPRAP